MIPGSRMKTVCILGNINPCENKAMQDNANHLSSKADCQKNPVKRALLAEMGVSAESVLQTRVALAVIKRVKLFLTLFLFFDSWYGTALYVSGSALGKELTWVSPGRSSPANISFAHTTWKHTERGLDSYRKIWWGLPGQTARWGRYFAQFGVTQRQCECLYMGNTHCKSMRAGPWHGIDPPRPLPWLFMARQHPRCQHEPSTLWQGLFSHGLFPCLLHAQGISYVDLLGVGVLALHSCFIFVNKMGREVHGGGNRDWAGEGLQRDTP